MGSFIISAVVEMPSFIMTFWLLDAWVRPLHGLRRGLPPARSLHCRPREDGPFTRWKVFRHRRLRYDIHIHSRALSNGYQVQCFWNLFRHGQNWQHRGTSGCLLLACNRLQGVATDNHGNLSPTWRTSYCDIFA